MPQDTKTVSAKLNSDSTLAAQFEEYRDANGMTSKSEAVRHLLRAGIEQEHVDDDDRDRDDDVDDARADQSHVQRQISSGDWIEGNELLLMGIAFLIGADGLLSSLVSVFGQSGGELAFASMGLIIAVPLMIQAIQNLATTLGYSDADDGDAMQARGAN
jgi:VIT1/CCC1 family predicted Fe2+/Mn2+ transporter